MDIWEVLGVIFGSVGIVLAASLIGIGLIKLFDL